MKVVFAFIYAKNLCKQIATNTYKLIEVEKVTGSETASTQRSQKSREKKKAFQCNTNATKSNIEIEKESDKIYIEEEERKSIIKFMNYQKMKLNLIQLLTIS